MKFKTAVECTNEIANFFKTGLDALSKAHKNSIIVTYHKKITGSVNIDAALQSAYPNENRWDYAIGYRISKQDDKVFFAEFHRAIVSEVEIVLKKKEWLVNWMKGKPLDDLRQKKFVWVSAGGKNIPTNSPQMRNLNTNGIQLVRRLRLG